MLIPFLHRVPGLIGNGDTAGSALGTERPKWIVVLSVASKRTPVFQSVLSVSAKHFIKRLR